MRFFSRQELNTEQKAHLSNYTAAVSVVLLTGFVLEGESWYMMLSGAFFAITLLKISLNLKGGK